MLGSVVRVAVAALLGVAVAGSFTITRYLSLLEGGIQRDLTAIDKIVAVEKAIGQQNAVLTDMVGVTRRIGGGMDGLLALSDRIDDHVKAVVEANRAALEYNGAVEANNEAAARELERVVAALQRMNASAADIEEYLGALGQTAAGDVEALEAVAANTARMNLKTPEVGW